jgi:SAM-dependent methyltransferase
MATGDKIEVNEQVAASIKNFSSRARDDVLRQRGIVDLPDFIQQKAAMISAHFLLPAGARIVDMGCGSGEVTYALALLNPRAEIVGVERDPAVIELARKNYRLPNLSFRPSEISIPDFEDESVDGIINSNILHGVYSAAGYNADDVSQLLEKQIHKLKPGGIMLIRDYMMPAEGGFVLLELPAAPSTGRAIPQLSDADLLISFSQSARPLPSGGCEGFFIEELRPKREGTRLFRLPHKWAVEFVHRKDYRASWSKEIREEYTFFTYQDYRREFARIGMRMTFSAPYWNPWVVKNCFKGHFQMYAEDYKPMSYPATNYFIVAQKVAEKQSLLLEERRPSQNPVGDLQIMVVRDKKTGALHELVKRPGEYCDIVPYRITADNRLVIFVRSGYPRPIVNAVSRGSHNLDGKKWSGHLIEPVTMDTVNMGEDAEENRRMIFDYVRNYAGLRPKTEESWYVGDTYFPSPDRIDEAIEPVFVEVENPYKTSWAIQNEKDAVFTEMGSITELDGADIMLASQVGLLPEPRLEMHVFALMARYNIPLPRWLGDIMPKLPGQAVKVHDPEDLLKEAERTEFEKEKREPIHLKPVKAVFVEEGKVGRTTRGLSAQDVEFIVTDDGIDNIAVVIPMTRDWDNNLLVALDPKIMPVPNRLGGDGAMLNAPSFVLPKDVKTIDDAKAFLAGKFKVPVEQVAQLGESYFTHVGVTPQRIYPFTVTAPPGSVTGWNPRYVMMKRLWKLMGFTYRASGSALKLLARVQMQANEGHGMHAQRDLVTQKDRGHSLSTEKVAVEAKDVGYTAVPSRILGQRGPAAPDVAQAAQPLTDAPARSGKSLSHSYTQAKMNVKSTPGIENIDKNIGAIARSLFQNQQKTQELTPPGEKNPPKSRL